MLNTPQARDVLLMLGIIIRENVASAAVGNEIEFLGARRVRGGLERGAAGVRDWPRRQAIDDVRIVRGRLIDLAPQNGTAERPFAPRQSIDDGGVGLKAHPAF